MLDASLNDWKLAFKPLASATFRQSVAASRYEQ